MIARKAGTLHVVQLNRLPMECMAFTSHRVIQDRAFSSLISHIQMQPSFILVSFLLHGDEIIRVNKENVKEKTVDYVHDLLEKLDSVIFSIVPLCSRPDW